MHEPLRLFGLIGQKLTHSFSPGYFNEKFKREGIAHAEYRAFPLENIELFEDLRASLPNLEGLSVTIPYKESIIPFLDELAASAQAVGAVNCIQFLPDGRLRGHNTDVIGFSDSLQALLQGRSAPIAALVLGSGGAAKAVCYVLDQLKIAYRLVSRQPKAGEIDYAALDAQLLSAYPLIVNTTPLGMFPNIDAAPALPYQALSAQHILYDLVYNPENTQFMQMGKAQGATVCNGLAMLYGQAEAAWRIWNEV